jgi:ABC-type enterobactin transport system permease subunit
MSWLDWLLGPQSMTDTIMSTIVALVVGVVIVLACVYLLARRWGGRYGQLLLIGGIAAGAMLALGVF